MGEAALTVFRTIGLSVYARADFIVTGDGTIYFLEINTLPGMTPTSLVPQEAAAVGIGYADRCETIVEASREARRKEFKGRWKPSQYGTVTAVGGTLVGPETKSGTGRSAVWIRTAGTSIPVPCSSPWWGSASTATSTSPPPWRRGAAWMPLPAGSRSTIREGRFYIRVEDTQRALRGPGLLVQGAVSGSPSWG